MDGPGAKPRRPDGTGFNEDGCGMLRIAMMTDSYFPTRDGVVSSICIIKESLEKMGHEVFIIAPEPEKEYRQEGVYYFPAKRFKSYEGYYVPIYPSNKRKMLKEIDPDVIHIHGVATMAVRGLCAGKALKIPTVMTFHTMVDDAAAFYSPIKLKPETMSKYIWIYLRQILKRMDVVVTPTRCIATELEGHGAHCRNLLDIPTGANTDVFRPGLECSDLRERYGMDGVRTILHVGRVSFEKEIDMVIRAVSRIDAQLLIAGKGPAKEDLERLVAEMGLGDKVRFLGFVPDEELPRLYNAVDMVVSASKFETQGLTILEAMASGKPVACRNGRAFAEIVQDGVNGYLFDDDDGCVQAIERCLEAPEDVRKASYATAMENSRERSIARYIEAYELAIETKKKRQEEKRR